MKYKVYAAGKEVLGECSFDRLREEACGTFESMRAYGGRIFRAEDHLTRLLESAKTVGDRPFPELSKLRVELKMALKAFGEKECYVRLTLWEGRVFVILSSRKHPKELYEKGVALKTAACPRGGPNTFPWQAKASAYQQAILASTEPHPDKIYEWVFLNQENFLTETRIGNFFIVKKLKERRVTLLTPPEHLILNGVTRRFVIKCALELGIKVQEIPLTRHEFFNADEAFLCNTSWEVLPVRELDGRTIGTGKPGPITLKLHRFFKRRVQQDVSPHRSPRTY
jgi:branched-chain amino acid aminotransferase